MIDTVQIVLLVVIVALTLLLVILGIQVFFILRDIRKTIYKANKVLDNTETITESVSEPMSFLSSFILGTKTVSKLLRLRKHLDE
jgi:hypothetical protein